MHGKNNFNEYHLKSEASQVAVKTTVKTRPSSDHMSHPVPPGQRSAVTSRLTCSAGSVSVGWRLIGPTERAPPGLVHLWAAGRVTAAPAWPGRAAAAAAAAAAAPSRQGGVRVRHAPGARSATGRPAGPRLAGCRLPADDHWDSGQSSDQSILPIIQTLATSSPPFPAVA